MLEKILLKKWCLCVMWPLDFFIDNPDKTDSPSQALYESNKQNETGRDRLYMMYSLDEFGNISPELNSACQAAFLGTFIGACYGGVLNSKIAYTDFMERNEATIFKNHLDAKKKLQDQVTIGFGKGAFRWGWRLGLFSGMYVLFTTSIAVYRGHSSIVEYVAAGGLTGALYKCNMGLRGMAVGGGLGSVLGGIAGIASLSILKLSGLSMEEVRFWQHQWKQERDKRFFSGGKIDDKLLVHHDTKVGSSAIQLDSLESQPSVATSETPQSS